jgi:hypothetical protein
VERNRSLLPYALYRLALAGAIFAKSIQRGWM